MHSLLLRTHRSCTVSIYHTHTRPHSAGQPQPMRIITAWRRKAEWYRPNPPWIPTPTNHTPPQQPNGPWGGGLTRWHDEPGRDVPEGLPDLIRVTGVSKRRISPDVHVALDVVAIGGGGGGIDFVVRKAAKKKSGKSQLESLVCNTDCVSTENKACRQPYHIRNKITTTKTNIKMLAKTIEGSDNGSGGASIA